MSLCIYNISYVNAIYTCYSAKVAASIGEQLHGAYRSPAFEIACEIYLGLVTATILMITKAKLYPY
jgi:hypothetical protein